MVFQLFLVVFVRVPLSFNGFPKVFMCPMGFQYCSSGLHSFTDCLTGSLMACIGFPMVVQWFLMAFVGFLVFVSYHCVHL